jgi:hypothetical protein
MKLFHFAVHKRSNATYIAGLAMLGLSTVLLATAVYIQHQPRRGSVPQTAYANGQTVSMGSVSLKINRVTTSNGNPAFPSPPGQHYVVVDLSVTNLSDQPINILPGTDIYLKTTTGEVSYLTPYVLDQPFHSGELSPGETVRGQISYAAGKTAQYKLYVDAIWSGGVIPFSLR